MSDTVAAANNKLVSFGKKPTREKPRMGVLNAAKRDALPKKDFALSGERFPLTDPTHDRLAISGATRSENAGNISPATAERIKTEARGKLGESKKVGRLKKSGAISEKQASKRGF